MLGNIVSLADNLWLIEGEMPENNETHPDIANAILYRRADRLYLIDSGVGPVFRAALQQLLADQRDVQTFTLLNSHAHCDHVGNNDLIATVQAPVKKHYISKAGLPLLDMYTYFARHYTTMSQYYPILRAYPVNRLKYATAEMVWQLLKLFKGSEQAWRRLVPLGLRKFEPLRPSKETINFFEEQPEQALTIGETAWRGWVLGEDDIYVLCNRGHSPDHVVFYLPEHHMLHAADLTLEDLTSWPDSDANISRHHLHQVATMAQNEAIDLLTDAHHHQVFRGGATIAAFVNTLLDDEKAFSDTLLEILFDEPGLTIPEVYERFMAMADRPVVQRYRRLEYPRYPGPLQSAMLLALLDRGCVARGPEGRKQFYAGQLST